MQKAKDDLVAERATLTIQVKGLESDVVLLQAQVEFETKERLYAEEKAANESITRAMMAMENEKTLQEARRYYKIV